MRMRRGAGSAASRSRRATRATTRGYDFRIFESTGENVLRLTADAVGIAVGHVPRAVRARGPHRFRA